MNNIFIEKNKKWYEQTIFLCLCFALWFFLIPLIVGLISLILFFINNYKRTKSNFNECADSQPNPKIKNNLKNSAIQTIENNSSNNITSSEAKKNILDELEKSIANSLDIQSYNDNSMSLYKRTKVNEYSDDYVVFDLETTGFDPNTNKIIEIGAIKYKGNKEVERFNYLINPQMNIPTKITKLTGITNEDVANCKTIDIILPKFIKFIENNLLVAHNGSFDFSFIEKALDDLEIKDFNNKNIDTLYIARNTIKDCSNHKLETLKAYFHLNYDSHRALSDCETTNYIYQYCKNKNK